MTTKWICTGSVTLQEAKERLANQSTTGPVWLRWFLLAQQRNAYGSRITLVCIP